MKIYDVFTAPAIATYWRESKNLPPFPGEIFFPNRKIPGLKFSYFKGKSGTPVALVSSAWDADVLYRDRIGFEKLEGDLPYFKEAYKIDETTRVSIVNALAYGNPESDYLIQRVFDDTTSLRDGALVTAERMRMQLMSTGTIAIAENGVNKNYDFGFDSTNQVKTLTTKWSAAAADPIADILDQKAAYETLTGEKAQYLLANSSFLNLLLKNAKVVEYFGKLLVPTYPTPEKVKSYVEAQTELTIIIDDKKYIPARKTESAATKFYPDGQFTLVSTLDLGETLYGDTPEEVDLKTSNSEAYSVEIVNPGIALTTWKKPDPVRVDIKASQSVLPSCPNIDLIYIVKYL